MNSCSLLFPGQGSQYVGMGQSLLSTPAGLRLLEEAQDSLGFAISKHMFNGPIEELTNTAIAQPAILLHSVAAFRAFVERYPHISIASALGHSLGEYSALAAASVLSFSDAIKTVHVRGKLMQEAVPKGVGAMAAVLGLDIARINEALLEFASEKSKYYAVAANLNGPEQTVIAGTKEGVAAASHNLKSLGAKRVIELSVSAPFHCALMKPAQEQFSLVLNELKFNKAMFPIFSNVSARPETDAQKIKSLLLLQMLSPVRFTDCVLGIKEQRLLGDAFLELGPKNTLSGIVKKIDRDFVLMNIDTNDDLAKV